MNKMAKEFGLTVALFVSMATTSADAVELLSNGNFETGTLASWTVTNQAGGNGSWFADAPGTTTPLSGQATAGNVAGGTTYAVSDQGGPGAHALVQSFTVPVGTTSILLSFDMFVNDWSNVGPIVNAAGLDFTAGANQHGRVDILTSTAGALSTAIADIVTNLYVGVNAGTDPNAYTAYLFNLTGVLTPGSTYQLRFAEVDNQLFLNMGVDNVSLQANVPEPATLALFGLGLAGLGAMRRKKLAA